MKVRGPVLIFNSLMYIAGVSMSVPAEVFDVDGSADISTGQAFCQTPRDAMEEYFWALWA